MTRRAYLAFILMFFPACLSARPKLGDDEWMRSFRSFVKLFNSFVESLNDGKFDVSTWQRMRVAFTRLDVNAD